MISRQCQIVFLLVLIFLLIGCFKTEKKASERRIWTEIVDGVEIVHNPAVPLHPEKTVRFVEEISFGTDKDGPGAVFKPGDFAINLQNQVYIFDISESKIKVFDAHGNFMRAIGRRGQGPGEFQRYGILEFCPDGRLLALDLQSRRTMIFGSEGKFLNSHKWQGSLLVPYLISNDAYTLMILVRKESESVPYLKTYDFMGQELKTWLKLKSPAMWQVSLGGRFAQGAVLYSPESILTGNQSLQRIFSCVNDQYLIDVYEADGTLIRRIERTYIPLPFTKTDLDEYKVRVSKSPLGDKIIKAMPFPKVKTVMRSMITDDRGYLWVQTHEARNEGDLKLTAYDIFDINGSYDARIWLDKPPGKFKDGKMYRLNRDEESDYVFLTRYRVIWENTAE